MAAIAFGILFLGVYFWFELGLPRGVQEFAYYPYFTHPMPFAPMRGFTFEQLARHVGRLVLMGPALLLLWWGLLPWAELPAPSRPAQRRLTFGAAALGLLVAAAVMGQVLEGRAIVDDELTYAYQADILANGRLADPSHLVPGFEPFTIDTRIGATGKYLPGEALVQVPGLLVGLPALAHLPLAALLLWIWFVVLRRDIGETAALWGTLLLALSPMFFLTTATGLSHVTALATVVLAGLGVQWTRDERPIAGAVLVASAIGFCLFVRIQVAVPVGAVLGLVALVHLVRRRHWLATAAAAVTGSAWVALFALYTKALTGSWTNLPWNLFHPRETYGFGEVWEDNLFVHTPWTAFENLLVTLVRFNGWWLGWPLSLGLVWLWWRSGRPRRGLALWVAVGLACILFLVPYYSTGVSETGPVYYFELLLPASVLGGLALAAGVERWPRAVLLALVLHLALATTTFTWENVARLDRLAETIHGPSDWALEQVETPALLLYEVGQMEAPAFGWIWSGFPKRWRDADAAVVTFPRIGNLERVQRAYPGRNCYYFRIDPDRREPELYRCDDPAARPLLTGPLREDPGHLRLAPTAERLGLIGPEALGSNNLGEPIRRERTREP